MTTMETTNQKRSPPKVAAGNSGRYWAVTARAAVTLAILGYLFSHVDLTRWSGALWESLGGWLVVALAANGILVLISTYKWDVLLRGLGIFARGWSLLKLYLIGLFVSACLPGMVGGDAVRWHMAGSITGDRVKVGATILAERALGVVALVVLCLLAVVLDWQRLATPPILVLCGGISLALVAGMTIALSRRLNVAVRRRTRRTLFSRPGRLAHRLHQTFRAFPRRTIVLALAQSFVFYFIAGASRYFVCLALSVEVSLFEAFTIQLLICLLLLVPISLGGLGLCQAGDVYLFALFGVAAETALAISIVRLVLYYIYVMAGGVLFVQGRGREAADVSATVSHDTGDTQHVAARMGFKQGGKRAG